MVAESDVVFGIKSGDIAHDVIGAFRDMAFEADLLQDADEVVTLRLIGGAEAGEVGIGHVECGDAGMLEGRGCANGEEIMHFADGVAEFWRSDHPADTPTGNRESFAKAVDGDGAVAQGAETDGGDVLFAVEDDVLVDLVANDEAIEFFAEICQSFELGEREDFARWVVR